MWSSIGCGSRKTTANSPPEQEGKFLRDDRSFPRLQGRCVVCFGGALDAVRFCHAAQVALLFKHWPPDCSAVAGPREMTPDNRPLFAGPRIALAVHTTPAFE